MRLRTAATLIAIFALLASSARGETCDAPTSNTLTLAQSFDQQWSSEWVGNQPLVDAIWNGLHLKKSKWDENWGFYSVDNPWRFLNRVISAGYVVRKTEEIAKHFPMATHAPTDEPISQNHEWFKWVSEKENDGWEPKCCNSEPSLIAEYDGWEAASNLCVRWAYELTAVDRAAALIHEAGHAYGGHANTGCMNITPEKPNGASCDEVYGEAKSNTFHVNFLKDAVTAYRTKVVDGKHERVVAVTIDPAGGPLMCGFVPLVSDDERDVALTRMDGLLNNFFTTVTVQAPFASFAAVDAAYGTPWNCTGCDPEEYYFDANTWKPEDKACNWVLNHENIYVNQANQQTCDEITQAGYQAGSPEELAQIKSQFPMQKCKLPDPAHAAQYCESEQVTAQHVDDVDEKNWLDLVGYGYQVDCIAGFCEESFDPEWGTHAGDASWDDPKGCLDALCEGDAFCREMFLTWNGNPDYYMRPDEPGGCKRQWLECYDDAGIQPMSCPGSEICPILLQPGKAECDTQRQFCDEMEQHARNLLEELLRLEWQQRPLGPGPDPGPLARFWRELWELEDALQRGVIGEREFVGARNVLYSHPESIAALYDSGPELFVELLGTEAYASVAGPSIYEVAPEDLGRLELEPVAQEELGQIEVLRSVEPYFERESLESEFTRVRAALDERTYETLLVELQQMSSLEAMSLLSNAGRY